MKTRIYYKDGRIEEYTDPTVAYFVYTNLSKDLKLAFRGADDNRPVYKWDFLTQNNNYITDDEFISDGW